MAKNAQQEPARQARTSRGQRPKPSLARELSELARNLDAEKDHAAVLLRIVTSAVDDVPGADHAGISMLTGDGIETPAATSDVVAKVDQAQYDTGQGPCVKSSYEHMTVRSDDLRAEERWPEFAARAVALGVQSMLSFQLYAEDDNIGALNLYAETPNAFDDEDESVGLLLASHAALALAKQREGTNLRVAISTRDLIGQAKGILMERYKITADEAFALLIDVSQRTHRKLREVAEHLTETGELVVPKPGRPGPPRRH